MPAESSVPNLIARFLFALGHELGAAQAAFTGPLLTLIDFRRDLSDAEVNLFLHTIDTQTARLTVRLDEPQGLIIFRRANRAPVRDSRSLMRRIRTARRITSHDKLSLTGHNV